LARDDCKLDYDKTIITSGRDFLQTLKDIGRSFGIGYDDILIHISPDCKTISIRELVDIAQKEREARDVLEENLEIDSATMDFIKLLEESAHREENELPF